MQKSHGNQPIDRVDFIGVNRTFSLTSSQPTVSVQFIIIDDDDPEPTERFSAEIDTNAPRVTLFFSIEL